MGAIIGDIIGGIISGILGGLIGFIIPAVKTTIFWGGDALICGIGNWCANAVTGIMSAGGLLSWVNVGAYGAYLGLGSYVLDAINLGINAITGLLGGGGLLVGGVGWIPALTGAVSGLIGGIGGTIANLAWNCWTTIEPVIASAIAACIGLIPMI